MKIKTIFSGLGNGSGRNRIKGNHVIQRVIRQCSQLNINQSLNSRVITEQFPWCFVVPVSERKDEFYLGAFSFLSDDNCVILYTKATDKWTVRHLSTASNVIFWCSRIIAFHIENENCVIDEKKLRNWVTSLQRYYSPLWESVLLKPGFQFKNNLDVLISEMTYTDCNINDNGGVSAMPWMNWPHCIKSFDSAWLWRLNRQGNILDSIKTDIRNTDVSV